MKTRLTKEQVERIPEELKTKKRTELAKEWKVSRSLIGYWIGEFKKRGVKIPKLNRSMLNDNYNEPTKTKI